MFTAASSFAREVDEAFYWIGGTCIVLMVGITVAMVWFVLRYRRNPKRKATQIEGNLPLELTWIIIPTILVLFMFFKGYEGFKLLRSVPEGAMEVEVLAQRWFWTFNYPGEEISSSKLYVPVNRPVKLLLTSPPDDVVHSFYLPAFRVKEDCVPGRQSYLWFEAERTGIYDIFCAEFCGRDHSKMLSEMIALPQEEYEEWLRKMVADKNKPVMMATAMDPKSEEILERGAGALFQTYCVSCHGANGKGGLVENARNFTSLEGWTQGVTITDIFRTLTVGLEGTQMRAFNNLPAWDRFALAHYVAAFYTGSDRPKNTPEEIAKLNEEYRLDEQKEPREEIPIEDAIKALAGEGDGHDAKDKEGTKADEPGSRGGEQDE